MKKSIFTSALFLILASGFSQKISVYYGENYSCNGDLFFAVRTVINEEVFYRLTNHKDASPGSTVVFDLANDMSDTYLSAADFTDPTRPLFGGNVGTQTFYYDASMDIGDIKVTLGHNCSNDSGKIIYTRDGEFHFTIVDDLNGLIR